MFTPSEKQWKAIGVAVGLLLVIGLVLFTADRCSKYSDRKQVDAMKANANAALANAAKIEDEINVLKGRQEEQLEQANRETRQYLDKINATAEAREETDKALANVAAAKNTNTVGVTVEQLQEKLRRLDQ